MLSFKDFIYLPWLISNITCKSLIKAYFYHQVMIDITFLGTSAMLPTKDRNHPSVYLEYKGRGILFDCGEGTQRQMRISGISPAKIHVICLSHWHGDHSFGLMGLLQTMSVSNVNHQVTVIGPKDTVKNIEKLHEIFYSDLNYELNIIETSNDSIRFDGFLIESIMLEHNVPTLGFAFVQDDARKMKKKKLKEENIEDGPWLGLLQQGKEAKYKDNVLSPDEYTDVVKGMKVSYVSDTLYCDNAVRIAKDADLVISESTLMQKHEEKSLQYTHLTAEKAAMIASNANAKELIITHFSQRYSNTEEIVDEARAVFPNTRAAFDFMKIKL